MGSETVFSAEDIADMRGILTVAINTLKLHGVLSRQTLNAVANNLEKDAKRRGFWIDPPDAPTPA